MSWGAPVHQVMDEARFVPDYLLPTCAPPAPAEGPGFIEALTFYWISTARLGPHLGAGGLLRAIAAHALAVVFGMILIGCAFSVRAKADVRSVEDARAVLAEYVLELASQSSGGGWTGAIAYGILLLVPIVE